MKRICPKCKRSKPSVAFDIKYWKTIKGQSRYRYIHVCEDCEKK